MASPAFPGNALVATTDGESSQAARKHTRDLSISDHCEENNQLEGISEDGEYDDDEDLGPTEQESVDREMNLQREMQREKALYPGAKTWASEEEKLFELLFMRQDLPILPAHWEVDFRNVPIGEANFSLSESKPPLIYAHGKEFLGK